MSSCCAAPPTKRADLSQDTLAQLLERQVRLLLDERAEALLAEAVTCRVHRLGDAVGEEHEQVAGAERQRHFLEQAPEHLAIVDLEAEHQPVRGENLDLAAESSTGPACR